MFAFGTWNFEEAVDDTGGHPRGGVAVEATAAGWFESGFEMFVEILSGVDFDRNEATAAVASLATGVFGDPSRIVHDINSVFMQWCVELTGTILDNLVNQFSASTALVGLFAV